MSDRLRKIDSNGMVSTRIYELIEPTLIFSCCRIEFPTSASSFVKLCVFVAQVVRLSRGKCRDVSTEMSRYFSRNIATFFQTINVALQNDKRRVVARGVGSVVSSHT